MTCRDFLRRRQRDNGIARSIAQPFPDSIQKAQAERTRDARNEGVEGTGRDCKRVTSNDQWFAAPQSIRQGSGVDLEEIRGSLCDTVDKPERRCTRVEYSDKERWEHGEHHFRRKIVEEAREPKEEDIFREAEDSLAHWLT